ncbi:MAG: signal peptidase I [Deltaproteobacteria bacterium]|nr:signal peptidase I [Deltaproteobacteria bacterium]
METKTRTGVKIEGTPPGGRVGRKGKVREYVEAFAVALLIALVVRTFVIQAFKIPSSSMENTLLIGDHIFVNKFLYGYHIPFTHGRVLMFSTPRRGDIIVFVFPEDRSKDFIKRVVGVPGDTVEIRRKVLHVNGRPVDERYVRYADGAVIDGFIRSRDSMPPVKVPPGKLFVMGDNRDRSYDSRFWGFVDMDAVIGKAMFIYFSVDWNSGVRWYEVLRYPELVRWDRIGHVLR